MYFTKWQHKSVNQANCNDQKSETTAFCEYFSMVPVNWFGLLNNRTRHWYWGWYFPWFKLIGIIVWTTVMVTALMYNYITQIYVDAIM